MKTYIFILILIMVNCGSETTAKEELNHISCTYLDAWDFKRCENKEVICYTNEIGLSCKFKD